MFYPFTHFTFRFAGNCCGACFYPDPEMDRHEYCHPGVEFSFKPFPEQAGPQQNDLETVETSQGPLYFSYRRQPWATRVSNHSTVGHPRYHSMEEASAYERATKKIIYNQEETWPTYPERVCHTGMLSMQVVDPSWGNYILGPRKEALTKYDVFIGIQVIGYQKRALDNPFKQWHIYQSAPVFNVIHTERPKPSLIVHVFDRKKA